jgi:hypothetical protein
MKHRLFHSIALILAAFSAACTQTPPEAYLTPEFEEVTIDDNDSGGISFVCRMSSMSQLKEYGLDYTDDFLSEEPEWTRVHGIKTGSSQFEVILEHLDPCTTYCYRLFIGNGRNVKQSAQNYFTTPE